MVNKYEYNLSVIESENALAYYLLGVFMTDGHVIYTADKRDAVLTSKDKNWLENIRDIIVPLRPINKRKDSDAYTLTISNTKFCKWLINNGCTPAKSLTIQFPKIPNEFLKDFIRGCWDGDGCLCIYAAKDRIKPRVYSYIASASKDFADSFYNEITKLNIKCSFHKMKLCNSVIDNRVVTAKNNLFKVHLSDSATIALIKYMYYDSCFCMPRKQLKSIEILSAKSK